MSAADSEPGVAPGIPTGGADVRRNPKVVVIGAGMAGILATIRCVESGITDVEVFEKADRVGGTWRENTYPGVACDVPSHLYRYSFAPNPDWSHQFAPGAEIAAYLDDVTDQWGIRDRIRFGAEVTAATFGDDSRWHLRLADGTTAEADIVIAATGVLHHPRLPDITGVDDFTGAIFHSARWDHSVELAGARVGVVGTGSTAVQIVCALVDVVGRLELFQRSAQWVLQIPNLAISTEDQDRYRDDPTILAALHAELSRAFADNFANAVVAADSPQMAMIEQMCAYNLEHNVHDPDLRERLRPDYRAACKRLIVSPNFYESLQKPNAALVTDAIERIEAAGIRTADGELHQLDVIVLATGFRADRFLRPIAVTGRNGVSLDDVWAQRPSAYLSVSIPEFPNLFLLNGPNGPVGNFSLIEIAELQMHYVLALLDWWRNGSADEIAATACAMATFETDRVAAAQRTVWMTGCRSWYLDDRGVPSAWPWTFDEFRDRMAAPQPADYDLRHA